MVFGPLALLKWFLIGLYFLGLPIFLPTLVLYVFEAILNLKGMLLGLRKPIFTLKASFAVSLVIIGEFGGLWVFGDWSNLSNLALTMLILDKWLAPMIALLFLVLSIPTNIRKGLVISRAKEIIKKHPHLITIGITGSYGKTSTKEFLASILEEKFKVLKTSGSNNTDIGVAKTIVENLKDQEIFVCEMAAYKKGEIKAICDIVHPKVGIITAINEQHLDLFGTLENTMKAKYELIEALPKNGLAVFNGNNQYCQKLALKTKDQGTRTILFHCFKTIKQREAEDIWATDVLVEPERLSFLVYLNEEKQQFSTNLLGKQNIENILAAVSVAHHLGMTLKEIAKAVRKLTPPAMTMKPYSGPAGSTLIDDTFNTNPAGVQAAIEYAKAYKGKKILVLQPMIELGEAADEAHRRVGEEAARVCDLIFLTNKNFNKPFLEEVKKVNGSEKKVSVLDSEITAERIKEIVDEESVVIFEGKEAARVLAHLT